MEDSNYTIAIDGPAAAGKSTVAKMIAEQLGFVYIDTGAMYRALTLKALQTDTRITDEAALINLLADTEITLSQQTSGQVILLDSLDVTKEVRTEAVTNAVSHIATHQLIREEMVKRQQLLAEDVSVIMDGRDIGSHVLPDANLKIYLIASVHERAERRHSENLASGFDSDFNKLVKEIEERDYRDSTRKTSPLVQAADAIAIDTTSLSIEEVVDQIIKRVEKSTN